MMAPQDLMSMRLPGRAPQPSQGGMPNAPQMGQPPMAGGGFGRFRRPWIPPRQPAPGGPLMPQVQQPAPDQTQPAYPMPNARQMMGAYGGGGLYSA